MIILAMALILLLFPSVAESPTIWSLSWPQTILQVDGIKYVMDEPGGQIVKIEEEWRNWQAEEREDGGARLQQNLCRFATGRRSYGLYH